MAKQMRGKAWNLDHDPEARPLGCNGRYGNSGGAWHRRRGQPICAKCKASAAHYARERRRGGIRPRGLEPCGTLAAAERHRFNKEPLCFKCRLADAAATQAYRDRKAAEQEAGAVHGFRRIEQSADGMWTAFCVCGLYQSKPAVSETLAMKNLGVHLKHRAEAKKKVGTAGGRSQRQDAGRGHPGQAPAQVHPGRSAHKRTLRSMRSA